MKKTVLLAMSCGLCTIGHAQTSGWIDLTNSYIQNAHYENNSGEYWEGTSLGFVGPKQNAEHYSKTYDTYQSLTGLPAGTYRLSLKAYYRAGDSNSDWNHWNNKEDDYRYAQLYATSSVSDYYTPIVFCSSAALSESLGGSASQVGNGSWWGGGDTKYIPNNMEAAYYWFQAGYYDNQVTDIKVADDGILRVGVRKDQQINSDWTCFTDWKLEYYGTVKLITSLSFSSSVKIGVGDTYQLTPTIVPTDATYKKLDWRSSKETVVTVDDNGLLTAIGAGTAVITATTTDGSNISAKVVVGVSNQGGDASSLIINEIMPANLDLFIDPSWNFGGFMEIYNPTDNAASIASYYLSDDPANLTKWHMPVKMGTVPAKGYKNIWFDHNDQYAQYQCPFKLDVDGGTIYISDSEGKLITSQEYPACFRRCSYARTSDGGNEWAWTGSPTPEATNTGSKWATEQLDLPVVSKEGQVFTGTLQVTVNIPKNATLRYTNDGTVPTLDNGFTSHTGVFSVSKSTVYRFRLFNDDYLPSDIKTCSYIYQDYDFCAPIISVVTDNKNINGNDYGIFVTGNGNGRTGRGSSSKANWNMDWDRPVSFEYIPDGGEVAFSQEVNMSAVGGWSRGWTPHSFKLKANKEYGINYMPYAFFENKPFIKNKTLQIRNGGNDNTCRIIDPAIATIVYRSGIDVDCQQYKPVFVYINGKLYNVLNMREPNNKHYAYANRGLDDDEMDQLEYSPDSAYVQMSGTREAFEQWYALSADAANTETYEQIKQLVDIDEFINYFAVEMYLGCGDWINNSNNLKAYRPLDGKFRFVMFDTDSYGGTNQFWDVENTQTQTLDYIYDIKGSLTKEIEITTIWLNMLQNEEFRKQFVDAFCLVAGSVFEPDRCQEIIRELATTAAEAMSQTGGSPWGSANGMINTFSSSRQSKMIQKMKEYHHFTDQTQSAITASIQSSIDEGRLLVNGQPVPTNKFSGTLFLPVTLTAEAPAGYKFVGWKGSGTRPEVNVFSTASKWSYYDQGNMDGTGWYKTSFSSTWPEGQAPLGYATGSTWTDFTTQLDWGTDKNNKRPTYYFRKSFTLDSKPMSDDTFTLSYTLDDGCIIYINGEEAGRFNMPDGNITYDTFASTYGDQFSYPQTLSISPTLFKQGTNVIAVEVHNNNSNSSDIHWDASLTTTCGTTTGSDDYVSTDKDFELSGDVNVIAYYEELTPEEIAAQNMVAVRINEVSAANSIYINDSFKKEDWVELYNTTDAEVDLAGMYLSDNVEKPLKYQFQQGTISTLIEPFGYRVIWCDKQDGTSQLHTSFKLGNDTGSMVLLTAADQTWADTLQYEAHNGDMTYGRYPDGANTVYAMNRPTIGASNTITSYDTIHIQIKPSPIIVDIDDNLIARDGDMSIGYSGGYILVKNEQASPTTLDIYNPAGQIVATASLPMTGGHGSWNCAALPQGIYIARAHSQDDTTCSTKFVIR